MEFLAWPAAVVVLGVVAILVFRRPLARFLERAEEMGPRGIRAGSPGAQDVGAAVQPSPADELLRSFDNALLVGVPEVPYPPGVQPQQAGVGGGGPGWAFCFASWSSSRRFSNYLGWLGVVLGVEAFVFGNRERGVELLVGGLSMVALKYVIGLVLLGRTRLFGKGGG